MPLTHSLKAPVSTLDDHDPVPSVRFQTNGFNLYRYIVCRSTLDAMGRASGEPVKTEAVDLDQIRVVSAVEADELCHLPLGAASPLDQTSLHYMAFR
jgi:hypothetical protein